MERVTDEALRNFPDPQNLGKVALQMSYGSNSLNLGKVALYQMTTVIKITEDLILLGCPSPT